MYLNPICRKTKYETFFILQIYCWYRNTNWNVGNNIDKRVMLKINQHVSEMELCKVRDKRRIQNILPTTKLAESKLIFYWMLY